MKWSIVEIIAGLPTRVYGFPEYRDCLDWLREKRARKITGIKGCFAGDGPLHKYFIKLVSLV